MSKYSKNYIKSISHPINKKKMYKKGKSWVIGSLTLLALTGLGITASTTYADTTATPQVSRPQSQANAIQQQAKGAYTKLVAHAVVSHSAQTPAKSSETAQPKASSATSSVSSVKSSAISSASLSSATSSTSQAKHPLMLMASPQQSYRYNFKFYDNNQLLNQENTSFGLETSSNDNQPQFHTYPAQTNNADTIISIQNDANAFSYDNKPIILKVNGQLYYGDSQGLANIHADPDATINTYKINVDKLDYIKAEFIDVDTGNIVAPKHPDISSLDVGPFLDAYGNSDVSIGNDNVITISNAYGLKNINFDKLLTPYMPSNYSAHRYAHYNDKAYEFWDDVRQSDKSTFTWKRSGGHNAIIPFSDTTTPLIKIYVSQPEFKIIYHDGSNTVHQDMLNMNQLKSLYNVVSNNVDHDTQYLLSVGANKYVVPNDDNGAGTPGNANDLSDVMTDLSSDLTGNKMGIVTERIPVTAVNTLYVQYAEQNPDGGWSILTPKNLGLTHSMTIHTKGTQIGLNPDGTPKGDYLSDLGASGSSHDLDNNNMDINADFTNMMPNGYVLNRALYYKPNYDIADSLINREAGYPVPAIKTESGNDSVLYFGNQPAYLLIGLHRPEITVHYVNNANQQDISTKKIQQTPGSTFNVSPELANIPNGYTFASMKGNVLTFPNQDHDLYIYVNAKQQLKPIPKPVAKTYGYIHVRYVDDSNNGREFWSDRYSDVTGTSFSLDADNYKNRYLPGYHFDKVSNDTDSFGTQSAQNPYVITVGYAKNPAPSPTVVIRKVPVPGPTKYVNVPGPTKYITKTIPGPTKYITKDIPGPVKYITKNVPGPIKYITKTVTGPTKYIIKTVPGPVEYVTKTIPGPVKYVTKTVQGPTQYVTKTIQGPTKYITKDVPGPIRYVKEPSPVKYITKTVPSKTIVNNVPGATKYITQYVPVTKTVVKYIYKYIPIDKPSTNASAKKGTHHNSKLVPKVAHSKSKGTINVIYEVNHRPIFKHSYTDYTGSQFTLKKHYQHHVYHIVSGAEIGAFTVKTQKIVLNRDSHDDIKPASADAYSISSQHKLNRQLQSLEHDVKVSKAHLYSNQHHDLKSVLLSAKHKNNKSKQEQYMLPQTGDKSVSPLYIMLLVITAIILADLSRIKQSLSSVIKAEAWNTSICSSC